MEVVFTFTVFPLTALLFLTNFPKIRKYQILYIVKYVLIYITVEFFLFKVGRIEYHYGWNIWWSLAWNGMMFPVFAIHHKKPLHAYFIAILVIFLANRLFPFKLD
jgi:hypothetical protein